MTRAEVMQALEIARNKVLNEKVKEEFKGWTRTIQYYFTNTDEAWYFKVENGIPGKLIKGEAEKVDIVFKMAEDILIGLMNGKIKGMAAFTSGKVKVKASMKDFSKMQKLV